MRLSACSNEAQLSNPEDSALHLDKAELSLKSGHLDAAEQTLEGLPAILSMDSRAKLSFTRVRSEAPDEETLEKKIAAIPMICGPGISSVLTRCLRVNLKVPSSSCSRS